IISDDSLLLPQSAYVPVGGAECGLKVTESRAGLRISRFPTRSAVLHSTENRYIDNSLNP
ncbi:hypothetical protein QUB11_29465, partial [Microcoleus sp. B6-A1]